ncbi:MAG: class I SAM-dependent methyltransferase [Bacteroidales bacterium]|nr:class I SAM-dependent methyltransferase [Bacteroidales bacterium]
MNLFKKVLSFSPLGVIFYSRKFIKSENKKDYHKRYINFDIQKNDKVLDIGSGGEPFEYATTLLDKFPEKTQHRYNKLKTNGLKFIKGDVQELPFEDKSFDFIYCSHVLEHVEEPQKALDEILRVGKKGYIEVPTKTSDIIFNFIRLKNFHKWHINIVDNTIIFIEYTDKERRDTGDKELFFMAHSLFSNSIQRMYRRNKDLFSSMFVWEGTFNYLIINNKGEVIGRNI